VDGTPYKACRKHHPVLSKQPRITAEIMAKAHEEVQAQRRADSARIQEIHQQVTGQQVTGSTPSS
jgi:DNA-binding protein H-NS